MIRIKVFPIKKVIYKLEITLSYISFLILLVLIILVILKQNTFKIDLPFGKAFWKIENDINSVNFAKNIIKHKIKFLSDDIEEFSKGDEYFENENLYKSESKDKNIIFNENPLERENNEKSDELNTIIVPYEKMEKKITYEVEELNNGKIKVENTIIKNYTTKKLNLNELKKPSSYSITDKTNFLIFHTHTSETYKIDKDKYSDFYRTEDKAYNIVSVGKILLESLKAKGYEVIQDETVHDYPSYNGAYRASLATVEKRLKEKLYDFVIDIHRDAISSNYNFRPTVEINGKSVAKLMFVIGTDDSGLKHDKWIENLKLAIMIQNRAEEMYPGLFREINLSKSRYNQQVSTGAMILEVGATGNTLEEAKLAMKYLAEVIDSLKE